MAINNVGFTAPTFVQPTNSTTTTATRSATRTDAGTVDSFAGTGGTDSGAAARQAAVDKALSSLRSQKADAPKEDYEVDVNEWMDDSDLAEERAPYEDRIKALGNQQPPLSPAEIEAQAKSIQNEWQDGLAIIKGSLELMISMVMFNAQNINSAMEEM